MVFLFNLVWSLRRASRPAAIPGGRRRSSGRRRETPPVHGNWGKELPVVYRWAYDYSVPGAAEDFIPQNEPAATAITLRGPRHERHR